MQLPKLAQHDSEVFSAIEGEWQRQQDHLELIASENYASPSVMQVQGSVLTNKYAEGYPGKRYYGGCSFVDQAEQLAIARAKKLFGADYVNTQPHSGSQANAAVFMALMKPGDTMLGMGLSEGGHLTHGSSVNFSGRFYKAVHYGLNAEGWVDMDQVRALALKHRPQVLIAGFSAYSRVLDWAAFRAIADEVGAFLLVDMAHVAGLVAAGVYPNPLPYADVVTTTTHKTLRGPRGGMILASHIAGKLDVFKKLNSVVFPGMQGGPLMHVIAAKAVAFQEALSPDFITYQKNVIANARALAQGLIDQGFEVVSGGTDNHMVLVDLRNKKRTGQDAEAWLDAAHITVNKNTVPGDPESPFVTSGIRLGTPAITTRGMGLEAMKQIALWLAEVVHDPSPTTLKRVQHEVTALCQRFPVYDASLRLS